MWAHDDLHLLMQVQDGMKAGLQELLSGERVGTVRRALAMAAAAIARIAVPANQWPALLPWLHGCTQSPSEAQRETALMLICSLIDTIGAHEITCATYEVLVPSSLSEQSLESPRFLHRLSSCSLSALVM